MACVHGLDRRFCALCNKPGVLGVPRASIGSASLSEIVEFLNDEQIRATYAAVGGVIGVPPRSLGGQLGPRSVEASWIVSSETGLPTGYSRDEMHPALLRNGDVIGSAIELVMKVSAWKAKRPAP